MVWDLILILRRREGVNVHVCLRRAIFGKEQTCKVTVLSGRENDCCGGYEVTTFRKPASKL